MTEKKSVYEIVAERIIASLESGVVPWRRPWSSDGLPRNLASGKEYRGINLLLLGSQGYESPYWLTFKQALERGGNVRKGEKSTPIVFWNVSEKENAKTGEKDRRFLLRYYSGFNVAQCDGIEVPKSTAPKTVNPIESCETIVRSYMQIPKLEHGGHRAAYAPLIDTVYMPPRSAFVGAEEYYSTLFHELVHSTGHTSRLSRDSVMSPSFGSHAYSFEELVAECGSAFLCGRAGIVDATIDNSAAYIASWVARLKKDPKWIVEAAGKAAKAADMIAGVKHEEAA